MKSKFNAPFTWFTTNPAPPANNLPQPPKGTAAAAMGAASYSNIIDLSLLDNVGLEVTWTGTAIGVISVMGSCSGVNFYALTFDPVLTQPAGASGGYLIDLNQFPFRWIQIQYAATSSTGALTVYATAKDLS